MTEEKKPRKTRKDKGKKRGKRIKNPRLQTGSIDFRHIGTSATMGQNLTALAGLISSSRQIIPTFSQDQYLINELRKKEEYVKNNELVIKQQNIPPQPSFEPYTEQAQEEENATQVRKAMGTRIARLNREEASLFLKGKGLEAKNILMSNELQQKQHQLIEQDKAIDLKRKSFLVEQIYTTTADAGLARIKSQLTGIEWTGKEIAQEKQEEGGLENYRKYLMEQAGLNPDLVDSREIKAGERGKGRKDYFYNPEKIDLQRAQEETPPLKVPELKRGSSQEEREKRFTQTNLYSSEEEPTLYSEEEELA